MKRSFSPLVLAAFFLFTVTSTAQALTLGFNPSNSAFLVGDTIDIDVTLTALENGDEVGAFEVVIDYDPTILWLGIVTLGTFNPDPVDILDLSDSTLPGSFILSVLSTDFLTPLFFSSGPGQLFTLATLQFQGLALGSSPLSISFGDTGGVFLDNDPLKDFASIAQFQNTTANVVPEPGTILLLLAGLAIYKRKALVG